MSDNFDNFDNLWWNSQIPTIVKWESIKPKFEQFETLLQYEELFKNTANKLGFCWDLNDIKQVMSYLQNQYLSKSYKDREKVVNEITHNKYFTNSKIILKLIELGISNPNDLPNWPKKFEELKSVLPKGFELVSKKDIYKIDWYYELICNWVQLGTLIQWDNNIIFRPDWINFAWVEIEKKELVLMSWDQINQFFQDVYVLYFRHFVNDIVADHLWLKDKPQEILPNDNIYWWYRVINQSIYDEIISWTWDFYIDKVDNRIKLRVLSPKECEALVIENPSSHGWNWYAIRDKVNQILKFS